MARSKTKPVSKTKVPAVKPLPTQPKVAPDTTPKAPSAHVEILGRIRRLQDEGVVSIHCEKREKHLSKQTSDGEILEYLATYKALHLGCLVHGQRREIKV